MAPDCRDHQEAVCALDTEADSSTPVLPLWSPRLVHTGACHASTSCGGGEVEEDLLLLGERDGDVLLGWGPAAPHDYPLLGSSL